MDQAQAIWKMLDDMAKNDPEAYAAFMKKNLAEGASEMKRSQGGGSLRNPLPQLFTTLAARSTATRVQPEHTPWHGLPERAICVGWLAMPSRRSGPRSPEASLSSDAVLPESEPESESDDEPPPFCPPRRCFFLFFFCKSRR